MIFELFKFSNGNGGARLTLENLYINNIKEEKLDAR